MKLDALRTALAALTHALAGRVDVYRVLVNVDGTVLKRIYRGSFIDRNHGGKQS